MRDHVINLDDAQSGRLTVVVKFGGMRVQVTKDRLLALLKTEQDYLTLMTERGGGGKTEASSPRQEEAPAAPVGSFESFAKQLPGESVSHASLSSRIKKVYNYSLESRQMRPAHMGLLREMIRMFDWVIPEHPNTHLSEQLAEMLKWPGTPNDFASEVKAFLKRYIDARPDLKLKKKA